MIEETGEHIVAGAGELHLEICLKDLQDDFMGGAEIKVGASAGFARQLQYPKPHHMKKRGFGCGRC